MGKAFSASCATAARQKNKPSISVLEHSALTLIAMVLIPGH
jgi:hypothetical protein